MVTPSLIYFMKPQAYTEFQPLEEVLVGRSYDNTFLDSLDVPFTKQTRNLMTHLLDETEEDYQNLVDTLKKLNVKVRRPDKKTYKKEGSTHSLSGAYLMNPRDDQIVIDNKIIFGQWDTATGKGFSEALQDYKKYFLPDPVFKWLSCASIVRLGQDIIVDSSEHANSETHAKRLRQYFEPLGYNIIYAKTHDFKFKNKVAHGDAVFAILKPGLILHASENSDYSENIFKGWDLIKLDRSERLQNAPKYRIFTHKKREYKKEVSYAFNDSKYDDERWYNLLDTWFTSLMGYSKETYFDVNCLVVDENNVIFSGYNANIFKELEKRQINPIVCPFRHRMFWDGGTHCITLDLKRKGSRERYL